METSFVLLTSLGFACVLMSLLWFISVLTKNAGIIDLGWTFLTAFLALFFVLYQAGLSPASLLFALVPFIWGGRLLSYLVPRVLSEAEDKRYAALRDHWSEGFNSKMFFLFNGQALLALLLALPFLFVPVSAELSWNMSLGLVLFLLAVFGEASSDESLRRFKLNPQNKGLVCRDGWWAYSRHPNYFFEFLIWLGIGVMTFHAAPTAFFSLLSPALMFVFLRYVTGVPPAERMSLKSRGEAFAQYQREVSPFVPWFRSFEVEKRSETL